MAEQRIRHRLDEASKERNDLQQVFVRDFPNYAALSKPEPLTTKEIQSLLDNDEALVVIDLDEYSYVWVVTKDRADWKGILIPAAQASETIETLRTALNLQILQSRTIALLPISFIGRCSVPSKTSFLKRRGCPSSSMGH